MARQLNKLTALKVAKLSKAGRYGDGGGLYLVVDAGGSKRWSFLYWWRDPGAGTKRRLREMGLGPLHTIGIAEAREKALQARKLLLDGEDPIAARRARQAIPTFGEMADEVIKIRTPGLRSDKSVARWKRALETHAEALRPIRVDAVTTDQVLGVLRPIWTTKAETAAMTRGYIEAVLDAAKAKGLRSGENPARWRGHLDHLLPKRQKLTRGHHAALPFAEAPAFVAGLRERGGVTAWAFEFLILTAARSGEVRGATWDEIDIEAKVWTVPAERIKAAREHRVPLSDRALEILEKVRPLANESGHVFPGTKARAPLSGMTFEMLLRRIGRDDITTHGFRSTFRDWVGEMTSFPREVAEAALAHSIGDAAEQAYRRGDALEKRRKLMAAWAQYLAGRPNVVTLRRDGAGNAA